MPDRTTETEQIRVENRPDITIDLWSGVNVTVEADEIEGLTSEDIEVVAVAARTAACRVAATYVLLNPRRHPQKSIVWADDFASQFGLDAHTISEMTQ